MTAQEILLASLDYKRLVEITGIPIPPAAIGLLNGLTEYLCAKEQAKNRPTADTVRRGRPEPCGAALA